MPFAYNISGVNAAICHGLNGFLADFKLSIVFEQISNYVNNGSLTVVKKVS